MDHFKYLPPRFSGAAKELIACLELSIDKNALPGPGFSGDIDKVRSHSQLNKSGSSNIVSDKPLTFRTYLMIETEIEAKQS